MGRDATLYLAGKGVKITVTDAWSCDAPFIHSVNEFKKTKNSSLIWEGHRSGMEIGYCHIEKLTNLSKLPPFGYEISCFPFKIKKASAGFIRAVQYL